MNKLETTMNKAIHNTVIKTTIICFLLFIAVMPVNAITINLDTTITSSDFSNDNQDITIDGAILTIDGTHTFLDIQLINGATLTHTQNTSGLDLTMNSLSIDATSKIDLTGKGRNPVTGEVTGLSSASHGGQGILCLVSDITNAVYGDLRQPNALGTSTSRQLGGGSATLNVTGTLDLNGQIIANGSTEGDSYWGGASGGSIWLTANTLSGVGSIEANGSNVLEAPGGGGRVAVYYDNLSGFDLNTQVRAFSGKRNVGIQAGAGTVYLKDNAQTLGEIRIVNQESTRADNGSTPLFQPASGIIVEAITVINAIVEIQSSDITNLSSLTAINSDILQPHDLIIDSLILTANSSWSQVGQLTVNTTYQVNNSSIDHRAAFNIPETTPYVISNGMRVTLNTPHDNWVNIEVQNNSKLEINTAQANLDILTINGGLVDFGVSHSFTTVTVENNGILTHSAGFAGFTLDVTNLTIDATSKIDITGKGRNHVTGEVTGVSAASHGGQGILRAANDITNAVYGDLRQPIDLGTSGRFNLGGGSITLNVTGTLDLNGQIIANGSTEGSTSWYGASGGSIWLTANTLSGAGSIEANGSNVFEIPGGGGRVAVYYDNLSGFDLHTQVRAFGGKSNTNITQIQGGAGTVYLKDNAQTLGEIRIVNQESTHINNGILIMALRHCSNRQVVLSMNQ